MSQPPGPTIYVSYFQNNVTVAPVSLVVRSAGDPLASTDAWTAAPAVAALAITAALAATIPARRAASLDPVIALRGD